MVRPRRSLLLLVFLFTVLGACTPMIHGVPEDRWARMTESERHAAREAYAERQRQWELQRAEQARRDAAAAEMQRREAHEQAHRDQEQIAAIHRGESGVYGDLIQVNVSGGSMDFHGKRMPYEPFTFRLANREQRSIMVRSIGTRGYRTLEIPVSYVDGTFTFDVGRQPIRLLQSPHWRRGELYGNLATGKHSRSNGAGLNMRVEIVPQSGMIVVEPHPHPERPAHPPTAPAPGKKIKIVRAETIGLYPDGFRRMGQCIHMKASAAPKSYVIERNDMAVVVEMLEVKVNDNAPSRKICTAQHNDCLQVSDRLALKVNGTAMFLHAQEVKRLHFENGATLLLSVPTLQDRSAKASALCWE